MIRIAPLAFAVACTVFCLHSAHAAMQLDRTRLVFNEGDSSAVIQARSEDRVPLLLQMWVEKEGGVGQTETDFIVDPPVMRLGPGRSRTMRIVRVEMPDPASSPAPVRESLYWLNVVEIPATVPVAANDATGAANGAAVNPDLNRLTMRVKTRLKLFYRPCALSRYSKSAARQVERLRFSAEQGATGRAWLVIENPAPIHQSLARLTLHPAGRSDKPLELDTPMLAPFERLRLDLPPDLPLDVRAGLPAMRLTFATINDNGNLMQGEQTL